MTYDEWIKEYKPVTNHIISDAYFNGYMYNDCGSEREYVMSVDDNRLWTIIIDNREQIFLYAGYSFANPIGMFRIGFFVTEKPWQTLFNIKVEVG